MTLLLAPLHLLQLVFLALWSVFWITLSGVAGLLTLNKDVPLAMARRCWASMHWRITGSSLSVEPLPDVDWSKPHIFVMNHQSMMDIPCAFAAIPANIRFVAKHTLKYVPFLGWYMALTGMIFVNRSDRRKAMASLTLAGERIRAGANILAFPEGTRSKDGRILPFKKGPFLLALEAKVPIIPVAIDGTGQVLPAGSFRLRRSAIRMKLGRPIETAHRARSERDALLVEVRDALIQLQKDIGGAGGVPEAIADAGTEGRPARSLQRAG
ncbi:1-acyl-sn-glycerol-3-phosphate acyltransferase [Aggregicoccus sp. 17bor-14]|uniref:lysophospholipid acyltransferase family protein n=1 Tax=Myxococcaceae TaxID=31 RepID=UPI00129CC7FF|nr:MULTISPECIES: lysophospholipid acyltransferase family protein [Myxococcaceae]MBF5043712.1 1-acyl-sn-glycerol-3-phosphate acyltransferase [Simulacricoccus sp. 17bor-14]MRI89468.1 1-acyl-sn-glycerol-3-phosphate acyltransferase [Aggregicoccus sp. 17bor-14]